MSYAVLQNELEKERKRGKDEQKQIPKAIINPKINTNAIGFRVFAKQFQKWLACKRVCQKGLDSFLQMSSL